MNDYRPNMSMRDYFAGQALATMGTWIPGGPSQITDLNDENALGARAEWATDLNDEKALKARAEWAYAQADAMLAVAVVKINRFQAENEKMKGALERAYGTMKDLPDFFEEGSHEHKALRAEADAIRAALEDNDD